jgi:hypothetical protein
MAVHSLPKLGLARLEKRMHSMPNRSGFPCADRSTIQPGYGPDFPRGAGQPDLVSGVQVCACDGGLREGQTILFGQFEDQVTRYPGE